MIAVVVPTIRRDRIARWQREWAYDLADAHVIVVEDNPERSFRLLDVQDVTHVAWKDIAADLGPAERIIPRRSSAVRSYGTLLAWRAGAEIIWHLDDDCYPEPERRGTYLAEITRSLRHWAPHPAWHNTIPQAPVHPRGFPYGIREHPRPAKLHHGLWSHVPDLDGRTQKANPGFRLPPASGAEVVPAGQFFPMCGMNLAFTRDLAPAMYMLLMGQDCEGRPFPFDRFDDMWAGLLAKRICDRLGWAVTSGAPSVRHDRASDPDRNITVEGPGIAAHERLWPHLAAFQLEGGDVTGLYRELSVAVEDFGEGYWRLLGSAMRTWASLFEENR